MFSKLAILVSLLLTSSFGATDDNFGFIYHGFQSAKPILDVDGIANFTANGLLQLTNETPVEKGHAFYSHPISFKNSSNGTAFSFSTTFVFGIQSQNRILSGHGMAFVIAPTLGLPFALPSQYLGLFNDSNNGNASNHLFAVELDSIENKEFNDINDNHVGIDINGLKSEISNSAGYHDNETGLFTSLLLAGGQRMQVWVEYNGEEKQINVTLAPFKSGKPSNPLLSLSRDLSPIFNKIMFVGFSSSTGSLLASHYVLGWSFKMNGQAEKLALSQLPKLPRIGPKPKSKFLTIGLPVIFVSLTLAAVSGVVYVIRRKRKFAEVLKDWELEYGPHRFKYKDLYFATKGFRETELLGSGGFGRVYRGVLRNSKLEIAVKRVSHESRQGMREFVAEIVSIGHLRHRNLLQLLGYCRRKGELLLVRPIEPQTPTEETVILVEWVFGFWSEGKIIEARDPKLGTDYVAEELELVLKLGLMCSHSEPAARPSMRQVVQYLEKDAPLPELSALEISDCGLKFAHSEGFDDFVGSFPSLMGMASWTSIADSILSVVAVLSRGEILEARDVKLGTDYVAEELVLVLKLGLVCSHSKPIARPNMRQVVQYLDEDASLPE
ncbi:hypothetical protein Pint_35377 [Pistacia integerrima]|uniref:Uncharacterized protein n=1 Tax=Pistacia integerrima TaxID=434235 RepID=A0ACC0Y113_9ROSI|nr:hypothetical protein Pint_35377 [Pistacia integerrima]